MIDKIVEIIKELPAFTKAVLVSMLLGVFVPGFLTVFFLFPSLFEKIGVLKLILLSFTLPAPVYVADLFITAYAGWYPLKREMEDSGKKEDANTVKLIEQSDFWFKIGFVVSKKFDHLAMNAAVLVGVTFYPTFLISMLFGFNKVVFVLVLFVIQGYLLRKEVKDRQAEGEN